MAADRKGGRPLFGPGALVMAAFVGPGTVTVCTLAGAAFGYSLIWALIFATGATMVLQDMAVRLGVGARRGLGEALIAGAAGEGASHGLLSRILTFGSAGLVLVALGIGNAAYEGGNLSGAVLGIEAALELGPAARPWLFLGLGVTVGALLLAGSYRAFEGLLIVVVLIMSVAFVAAFLLVRPDWSAFASGFVPRLPDGATLTAVALIGTTIVPYNLFLHAATARERWSGPDGMDAARSESRRSIGLGGLISVVIVGTAAASLFQSGVAIKGAGDMAASIEPVFGPSARYLIAAGLCAAGLTSAITAPLATGYVVVEVVRAWRPSWAEGTLLFRSIALAVLAAGTAVAISGADVIQVILIAQIANGLLLPVVAIFLIITMNRKSLLGDHANGIMSNGLGIIVVLVAIGLGVRSILRASGVI